MKSPTISCCAVLLACMIAMSTRAEPTPVAREEVQYLLDFLGKSQCTFYRNGEWHDAVKAKQHLNRKYAYLVKKDLVRSTEDFIRLGATESSSSGEAYQVKCKDAATVASATWMGNELQRYRTDKRTVR